MGRILVGLVALVVFRGSPAGAALPDPKAEGPAEISYFKQVRKIFQQHCQGCHQPAKAMGDFVMTSYSELLKAGSSSEPGVSPGKPDQSALVKQITAHDGKPPAMPKGKPPLIESDVNLIKKWIVQGAKDDTPLTAKALVDMDHPPVYVLPPVINALAYSPDGSLLAVSGYHEVLLHNADGSGLVARLVGLSERVQSVAFSPNGKFLAMAGGDPCRFGEVQIWDVAKKKLKLSTSLTFDTLYGVSWSPDGTKVAFGCADNTLRAIDAETGKQVLFQGAHNDWVLDTVFSTDGEFLVSVSRDRSMKLTEVATQRFNDNITSITPGVLKGGLESVDRHPYRDELLIGGSDGVPKIYHMYRYQKRIIGDDFNFVRAFDPPMPGRIFAVKYSPDGNRFVVGSSLDGTGEVRVYQSGPGRANDRMAMISGLPTMPRLGPSVLLQVADFRPASRLVSKLEGQRGPVYTLGYRPDGKQVASAGFDGLIRLNDPDTGKLIKEFMPVPLGPAKTVSK